MKKVCEHSGVELDNIGGKGGFSCSPFIFLSKDLFDEMSEKMKSLEKENDDLKDKIYHMSRRLEELESL